MEEARKRYHGCCRDLVGDAILVFYVDTSNSLSMGITPSFGTSTGAEDSLYTSISPSVTCEGLRASIHANFNIDCPWFHSCSSVSDRVDVHVRIGEDIGDYIGVRVYARSLRPRARQVL